VDARTPRPDLRAASRSSRIAWSAVRGDQPRVTQSHCKQEGTGEFSRLAGGEMPERGGRSERRLGRTGESAARQQAGG
jgi:hypothetical protein